MRHGSWQSLPAMMLDLAGRWADRPMLRHWRDGAWRSTSWGDYALAVASVAAGLRARGVMPGDRVAIVSDSRPEFPIADTAIMAIGAVSVPTYTTNTVADHAHVLRDSGARAAIAGNARLAARLREAAGPGGLDLVVVLDGEATEGAVPWSDLLRSPTDPAALLAEVAEIPSGRLACLIYTSGTGGAPKGVMLPHRALLANRAGVLPVIQRLQLEGTPYLSFLPLSHAYEHTVGCFLLPSYGMEVVYSRGADKLAAEMQLVKPTLITAVPRLFEVLRGKVLAGVEDATPFRRRLFDQALALGLRKMDGPALNPFERVADLVLDRLVRRKVRDRFGGAVRVMVSGGARLDPDLSGFFMALGLPVLQGYGQTEAGPVIAVNLPWDNHRRTVGPPLAGVEARLGADGELLVRGDLVMDGYWGAPEATTAAVVDGWLHTGDVASLAGGRITILDRKKDFIKTLGGDMVSPAKIEGLLTAEPEIAQAVVSGEGRAAIVALVVPVEGADPAAAVARVNGKLSNTERVRKWAAVAPFTVDDGTLTSTMKVKRRVVLERHAGAVRDLYGGG